VTPEGEDDGRQNGSEHDEPRAAGCTDQHHVGRVAARVVPPAVSRRPVIARRLSVTDAATVVDQRAIDDQRQVECRRQRWTSAVSSNYPQFYNLPDHTQERHICRMTYTV